MHDITGHYNQFGVLSLRLNRAVQAPLVVEGAGQEGGPIVDLPTDGAQVPRSRSVIDLGCPFRQNREGLRAASRGPGQFNRSRE